MAATKPPKRSASPYLIIGASIIVAIGAGILVLFWILNKQDDHLVQPAVVEQRVSTPALQAKVEKVVEQPARELMTAELLEGKKSLIVTVSVKNTTSTNQQFLPVNHVFIKGAGDGIYQMSPVAGVPNPIVAGTIKPSETLTGDMSFVIDEDEADNWLYIDTRWNGMSPIVIKL